jgi:hypothetical protein
MKVWEVSVPRWTIRRRYGPDASRATSIMVLWPEADINAGLENILLQFLLKRSRLY